jgi:uncharacterized membrane protein YciS (DUF1049 family)
VRYGRALVLVVVAVSLGAVSAEVAVFADGKGQTANRYLSGLLGTGYALSAVYGWAVCRWWHE